MTVRKIQAHLEEMYGTEVSPSLISSVTDAVSEEVKAWQSRPLDAVYPIVYLDCIHVKVREGAVRVKAVYLALGVNMADEEAVAADLKRIYQSATAEKLNSASASFRLNGMQTTCRLASIGGVTGHA